MTNQQHPITPPPPHLLKKFSAQAQAEASKRNGAGYLKTVATLCIEWFVNSQSTSNDRQIRSSEIAPPPTLKEQALKMLRPLMNPVMTGTPEYRLYERQAEIIRRALEALDD